MPTTALQTALLGLDAGLSIVPPREDGSKAPVGEWGVYQTRRPTRAELEAWYRNGRTGVGVVCGHVSRDLECLEFELESAYQAFLDAAEACGLGELVERIDAGYSETSGGGGVHWLYFCAEISGNTKLAREPDKVLIETRGEGGYVITAPSNGNVHPSGEPYILLRGGFGTIATITPDERADLFELARSLDRMPRPAPIGRLVNRSRESVSHTDHLRPGDDYNTRTSWPELLEPAGWTLVYRRGEVEHWRRPDKARGISATTNHAGSDLLWVFSTSTVFESERSYDRFGAWAKLHGYEPGSPEATAELGRLGYGERRENTSGKSTGSEPPEDGWEWPAEADSAESRPEGEPKPERPKLLIVQPRGTRPERPRPATWIDGILDQGEFLVLGAARASYKSWWGMDLADILATGTGLFMGAFSVRQPARVLYCHGEIDDWAAYDRWRKLGGDAPGVLESFERWRIRVVTKRTFIDGTMTEFTDAVLDGRVEATIAEHGIDVLIIDPWKNFYAGQENNNDQVEAALDKLRDLQLRYGLTIVILHHFGLRNEARDPEDLWRGASRLADWASTRITLTPFYSAAQAKKMGMNRKQTRQYALVRFLRRLKAAPDDISVKWNLETGRWERWRAPAGEGDELPELTAADVAAKCPDKGWESTTAAQAALKLSYRKTCVLLEDAKLQKLLENFKGERNKVGWRRPVHPEQGELQADEETGET